MGSGSRAEIADRVAGVVLAAVLTMLAGGPSARAQQPPPDAAWMADASLEVEQATTDSGLGAVQGVVLRDGMIYAYGDVHAATPRVGVIREYTQDLRPTGRVVWLNRGGRPLIIHPTGLTWDAHWGTFLGDTVLGKAVIYRLDWDEAWRDGNLDRAVLATIVDDVAINGCRPVFVQLNGRSLLATADYGDLRPEIRLYEPAAMLAAGRTSAPGVVTHRVLCGPFSQNLHWEPATGRLICIQNVMAGRGWRLDALDLSRALSDGRADGPGVRISRMTFPDHDELEGFWPLAGGRSLFVIARRHNNLLVGTAHASPARLSPPAEGGADTSASPSLGRPATLP